MTDGNGSTAARTDVRIHIDHGNVSQHHYAMECTDQSLEQTQIYLFCIVVGARRFDYAGRFRLAKACQ